MIAVVVFLAALNGVFLGCDFAFWWDGQLDWPITLAGVIVCSVAIFSACAAAEAEERDLISRAMRGQP